MSWRRSWTRCSPPTPDVVAEYRAGDDKSKKKKRGAFMGMVMSELKGDGNVGPELVDERLEP